MAIHESAEDYLETILILRERSGNVRSIDVATELHFSKPSVSIAMKKLRESGHVEVDEAGQLRLTPLGETVAQRIYGRHQALTQMLVRLGVEPETAAAEACRMEHAISDDTMEKIRAHMLAHPDVDG